SAVPSDYEYYCFQISLYLKKKCRHHPSINVGRWRHDTVALHLAFLAPLLSEVCGHATKRPEYSLISSMLSISWFLSLFQPFYKTSTWKCFLATGSKSYCRSYRS